MYSYVVSFEIERLNWGIPGICFYSKDFTEINGQ